MLDTSIESTLNRLRAVIGLALGVGASELAVACGQKFCPETRAADYVCYDLPSDSTSSTGTSGETTLDITTSSETGPEPGSGSSTSTSSPATSGGESSSATGSDDRCAAFAAGPPDMPEVDFDGPHFDHGQCCFYVGEGAATTQAPDDGVICGRPFCVAGLAVTAPACPRADWLDRLEPRLDDIDAATRAALADAWLLDAAAEHASVASFARFTLELVSVGAPAELVGAAQRAIGDEISHARSCYALASAYAGAPLGPGAMPIDGAFVERGGLAELAASTVREGCVGETLAALHAGVAAQFAHDPVVRAVLERIAADEARHAALAWRFVAWALDHGPRSVEDAVQAAFANLSRSCSHSGRVDLSSHGQLGSDERVELDRRGLAELVVPLAHALGRTGARGLGHMENRWSSRNIECSEPSPRLHVEAGVAALGPP